MKQVKEGLREKREEQESSETREGRIKIKRSGWGMSEVGLDS